MKRATRISILGLIVLGALLVVAYGGISAVLSRAATREVNKFLATLPEGQASCGDIQFSLLTGTANVNDVRFAYRAELQGDSAKRPGMDVYIGRVEIGHVLYSLRQGKKLTVNSVSVLRPTVELWLDEKHPETCLPAFMIDTNAQPVQLPFQQAELKKLLIDDASMQLHSVRTALDVAIDHCSLSMQQLAYDSAFHFNDSVYSFSLAHAAVTLPDGSMKMQTRDIAHSNQGEVRIGASRIVHNMDKLELGNIVQEPVTWIDMQLQSVVLSPLNPIRKALKKDFTVQHINAVVSYMDVFRDERFKLKHPTVMPQRILMNLPMTFYVKDADVQMQRIHIGFAITDTHVGLLDFSDINAHVAHITNRSGYTMRLDGSCPMGEGIANARFDMTMNRECNFRIQLKAKDINTSFLDGFIRPFAGISSDCKIDSIYTNYTGNDLRADGTFRMVYHDFKMKVNKGDDIPFEIITRHAGSITRIGNAFVPGSNPPTKHAKPRGYQVSWKRDEMKDVELYLFGPIIDGVKKTFLPGLYVHLRTKDGEIYD